MKFVISDGEPKTEVKLELSTVRRYNTEMVYLEANGRALMGFKDGKYRLFSDAGDEPGLVMENNLIVQDQTL